MSLSEYYNPRFSGSVSREQLIKEDRAELQVLIRICDGAQAMRRRLGGDATSDELANDKKKAKRLVHCFRQSLRAWEGVEDASDALSKEVRRRAATVRWEDLAQSRRQYLLSRYAPYATIAVDAEQEPWGYHILTLLNNELGWLDYAMR